MSPIANNFEAFENINKEQEIKAECERLIVEFLNDYYRTSITESQVDPLYYFTDEYKRKYGEWLDSPEGQNLQRLTAMKYFTPWAYADEQISPYAEKFKEEYEYNISKSQEIYSDIYKNARGLVNIRSAYKTEKPVFIHANSLFSDAEKALRLSESNFDRRKITLCTYQALKGKKTLPEKGMMISVCGFAIEIKKDMYKLEEDDFVMVSSTIFDMLDNVKKEQIPKPTYVIFGAKDYFVYLFDRPVCLITTPQKRRNVITLMENIAQGIADRITDPEKGLFAVPVKLNGHIPAPASYASLMDKARVERDAADVLSYFKQNPDNIAKALKRKKCRPEQLVDRMIGPDMTFVCLKKGLSEYDKTGGRYSLDSLTDYAFKMKLSDTDKKGPTVYNKRYVHISIRPTKYGNIYDMLLHRMEFIRKLALQGECDIDTALEYYWIYANQAYKSYSKAYKALERLYVAVYKKAVYTKEIVEITKIPFGKRHTHKRFFKVFGLTQEQALEKGFKMRTEEELKEYQREYHKEYFRILRERKWASEGCKYYAEVKHKKMEKALKLYKSGWNIEKIAKRIDRSVRTTYKYIQEMKEELAFSMA